MALTAVCNPPVKWGHRIRPTAIADTADGGPHESMCFQKLLWTVTARTELRARGADLLTDPLGVFLNRFNRLLRRKPGALQLTPTHRAQNSSNSD
jgi:hypothetical protein